MASRCFRDFLSLVLRFFTSLMFVFFGGGVGPPPPAGSASAESNVVVTPDRDVQLKPPTRTI